MFHKRLENTVVAHIQARIKGRVAAAADAIEPIGDCEMRDQINIRINTTMYI
jgi:hypothetical protein